MSPSAFDPSWMSDRFASSSHGYLSTPAAELPEVLARLPVPRSVRENAIVAAIQHGIAHPDQWEKSRKPITLSRNGWSP